MNSKKPTVGVVFITHTAKHHLPHCLPPLLNSSLKPRVLVVNSSSKDGTVELAQLLGAETLVIPRSEFNHGATRELARKHLKTDIVVMMTPDAYAIDSSMLEMLIQPIVNDKAAVTYARQIPHVGANFFEAFARDFNYPKISHIRSIQDAQNYGAYTFFCSNACAAYSNTALDAIGGFEHVLLGEDTVAVAKLLHNGQRVAYVAEAVVKHSHRYGLLQEFKRNFDTGLARKSFELLIRVGGSDMSRGKKYVLEMSKYLARSQPALLPYAFLQSLAKCSGYKIGRASNNAPLWFKKVCSSQDFYWNTAKNADAQ